MTPSDLETVPADRSALVLFSGGQDSTACLAWALTHYERVETIGFDYGQRHAIEMTTRTRVLERFPDVFEPARTRLGEDHVVDLKGFGRVAESSLTREQEIRMGERGLPNSFVPGRNLAFFVYAAAVADRRGIDHLVGGMCETDFSGYPDCRKDTLEAMQNVLNLGIERPYIIDTPLMFLTKAETWALTHQLGGEALVDLVLEDTHTCYMGQRGERHAWGYGCGTCPACELRARGFEQWRNG
ncbi:7-cyano-7-deazaguanine synthase QueC [Asticcacaulis sp. DW145]|uniref:7-cyano-7-deazaguanine synthase n=1 Tax=Asticcacaulis currens TaxID=2984210 RepID=A0ABT5IFG7_9CAUL|nr:7-cyano-7-deazaguanine synthase QueC [Asticcacaulis currens]MDC7694921.1 7-cyano-7-deazaguanine synthase QueC [Asticcacaulis currens]BEV12161.1 7-cyano-7-deazaguanine synthase QueC [Asticcacaulis sp. DW145]